MAAPPTPQLTVDGTLLPEDVHDAITRIQVHTTVHAAGRALVRFDDPERELLDRALISLGATLEVGFATSPNGPATVFTGSVTGLGSGQQASGTTPSLEVTALDASHRLQAASDFTSYLGLTAKEVVAKIAHRHQLDADCVDADMRIPYLVQSETDHAFLNRLATLLGFEWFTEGTTLHFRPRPPVADARTLTYGVELERFEASYSGQSVPSAVAVHSWDPAQQKTVAGSGDAVTTGPTPADLGSDAPMITAAHRDASAHFGRTLTLAGTATRDGTEADSLAASIARQLIGDGLHAMGVASGALELRAGRFVAITKVGAALSGHYYVTEVVHEFGADQHLTTTFTCGGHRRESSLGSAGAGNRAGEALGSGGGGNRAGEALGGGSLDGFSARGLQIAVVTNTKDPERLGRVKLRFPALGDGVESDWARVVVPGGGKERGLDLRPEVDDEVVVGFERGDARMPFVLGGLFHGKAPAPDGAVVDGTTARRTLRSREGLEIALVDGTTASEQAVEITLPEQRARIVVGHEGIVVEATKALPIALRNPKASLTLTDDGKLVVAAKEITLSSDGDLSLSSKGATNIKATSSAKVDGGQQVEVAATMATVSSKATTTIKGTMVKIN